MAHFILQAKRSASAVDDGIGTSGGLQNAQAPPAKKPKSGFKITFKGMRNPPS
jgi:hypothetical protein